jgi:hypothetical protein
MDLSWFTTQTTVNWLTELAGEGVTRTDGASTTPQDSGLNAVTVVS